MSLEEMLSTQLLRCSQRNEYKAFATCAQGFVVANRWLRMEDVVDMFRGDDELTMLHAEADMFDVLICVGKFQSKGDAKRNWQGQKRRGWSEPLPRAAIPKGWTEAHIRAGLSDFAVFIWNPPGAP